MKFLFVRHGESIANIENVFSNTGYKHGLTGKGRHQAENLSEVISANYPKIDAIYCSPLQRAVETAEILKNKIHAPVVIDKRLIEFFTGELEGKTDAESWNLFNTVWNEWILNKNYSATIPSGESFFHIIERMQDFIARMDEKYRRNEIIVCVSHGGVLRTAIPYLVGDTELFRNRTIDNAEIIEIDSMNGILKYLEKDSADNIQLAVPDER
jgi:broad specificity phosphatase PhoE